MLFSPSGTKLFAAAPRSLLFDKAAHFFRFAPFLSESVCVCVGVNREAPVGGVCNPSKAL